MTIHRRARALGDDVNTDYIISSSRKRATIDPRQLPPYLLEAVSPEFAASVRPGDVLVAGRNFGCGSAMEVAVTVIQAAGAARGSTDPTAAMPAVSTATATPPRRRRLLIPVTLAGSAALLAVAATSLVVPMTETSGSIWVLDNVKR